MKSLLMKTFVCSCLAAMVAVGWAAQDQKAEKKKKGNDPTAGLRKKLDESDLGPDLKERVVKVIDEHAPKIKEASEKVDASLTETQRQAAKAARKAARDAGKKGKEAAAEVEAALKLNEEEKKKYDEAQANLQKAQADMNEAVGALLDNEQKAKLGLKGKKKKKKNA